MEPITIDRKESRLRVAPEWADVCFTCGTCAGDCPVSGRAAKGRFFSIGNL